MSGGFSFCGVDIADLFLEYAPEKSNMYVYSPAQKQVHEETMEAHDGGYFYGVSTGPKDFVLRCYYEGHKVLDGHFTALYSFFRVGRTGKLVFDKRPWCWYTATVMNIDTSQLCNYENGVITIKLRAYYPFARCDFTSLEDSGAYRDDVLKNSAMLEDASIYPTVQLVADDERMTQQTSVILYNPGTERAKVAIEIAGDCGDGVTVANATTNQLCKFVALSDAITTNADKYLVSDALNGKTVLTDGSIAELAFLYHDNGFLELEPAYPILRDVTVQYTEQDTNITCDSPIYQDVIGMYIYIDDAWRKIVAMPTSTELTVSSKPSQSGTAVTDIVLMNELTITPVSTMSLSKLNIVFSPTFS